MNTIVPDKPKAPGFYRMSAEAYHRDPAPEPSLSSSIAKTLIAKSPRHAWVAHPRLNPDWQAGDSNKALDFGSAAHRLLLGTGRDILRIEHDDFRTKAAREARDEAIAGGLTPMLAKDLARAEEMVAATRKQLSLIEGCENAFAGGDNEVALFWQEGDTWCRAMVDNLLFGDREIANTDFKTTNASAAPQPGARRIFDLGYHLQAAFYERGLRALTGESDTRPVVSRFVMQETEPPYLLSVFEIDEEGREIGRKMAATALAFWRRCLADNVWPGYPARIVTAEIPPWAARAWLDGEAAYGMLGDGDNNSRGEAFDILARWSPPAPRKQQFTEPV